MMENRSFDHMCGFLKKINPEINGLTGDEYNYYNSTDPTSKKVFVNEHAIYVDPDPDHSVPGTSVEVFGGKGEWRDPAPMSGFLQQAVVEIPENPESVMACFNHTTVPIISALAQEFAISDSWYAAIPGPTHVNRMYVHSGTSHGAADTNFWTIVEGFPQKPIYMNLEEQGYSWGVYFELVASSFLLDQMRSADALKKAYPMMKFFEDAQAGTLPNYAFLDPRYYPFLNTPANDQHPSHSVDAGEALMKEVYEALVASPQWNETLFIITYDEHGGFYDHQPTPLDVPNPDGLNSTSPAFNFTRLGVRIPTLLISPWIEKGTVLKDPVGPTATSKFDHTSIPATLKKIFGLPEFLTKRDAWSGTFESVFSTRTTPRTDCPERLPVVAAMSDERLQAEKKNPLSHLQRDFMGMAAWLAGDSPDLALSLETEEEGGLYVKDAMERFIKKSLASEPSEL